MVLWLRYHPRLILESHVSVYIDIRRNGRWISCPLFPSPKDPRYEHWPCKIFLWVLLKMLICDWFSLSWVILCIEILFVWPVGRIYVGVNIPRAELQACIGPPSSMSRDPKDLALDLLSAFWGFPSRAPGTLHSIYDSSRSTYISSEDILSNPRGTSHSIE